MHELKNDKTKKRKKLVIGLKHKT